MPTTRLVKSAAPKSGTSTRPEPEMELVWVTQEIAEEFLSHNTHNRGIMQSAVDEFFRILDAPTAPGSEMPGDWKLTPDAVAFDWDGTLLNGQHRLWAIFESGITAPLYVVRGLDPESQLVTDQGRKRALHDQLTLTEDMKITRNHVAIAKATRGGMEGRNGRVARMNISEVRRFLGLHWNAIDFAERVLSTNSKGVSTAAVKSVFARAYYHLDVELLNNFGWILVHGVNKDGSLEIHESSAVVLRDLLLRNANRAAKDAKEIYARTERALKAFAERKPLKHRAEPVTEEQFLLPEEAKAVEAKMKAEAKKKKNIRVVKREDR